MYVLIIEDDVPLQMLISDILIDSGHVVQTASDGIEALSLIGGIVPDIIVTDLKMPNLDGCRFTQAFRKSYGHDTPIIMMSAAYQKHQITCLNIVDAFLEKPFSIHDLLSTIELLSPNST